MEVANYEPVFIDLYEECQIVYDEKKKYPKSEQQFIKNIKLATNNVEDQELAIIKTNNILLPEELKRNKKYKQGNKFNAKKTTKNYCYVGQLDETGQPDGVGEMLFTNPYIKYLGYFVKGKPQGYGEITTSEYEYIGEIQAWKKNGQGKYTYKNGDKYEGEWKEDKKHGQGKYTYKNGTTASGTYENNILINGEITCNDGSIIKVMPSDGESVCKSIKYMVNVNNICRDNGEFNGEATLTWKNKNYDVLEYKAKWTNNNAIGTLTINNKNKIEKFKLNRKQLVDYIDNGPSLEEFNKIKQQKEEEINKLLNKDIKNKNTIKNSSYKPKLNIIKNKKLDNEADNLIKHNINSVSPNMENSINNDKNEITKVSYYIIKIPKDGGEYDEKKDKEYLKEDIPSSFEKMGDFVEQVKKIYQDNERLKDCSHILFVHYNFNKKGKSFHFESPINKEGIKTTDFGIKGLKCKIKYDDDDKEPCKSYEGEMKNDCIEGNGKMCYKNGATYEGTFKNGCQEKGKITCSDGIVIDVETITDKKTQTEKQKRTLNGADVSNICQANGDFIGCGDIIWNNGNSTTMYNALWNNNEVELDKNAKPLKIPILTIKEKNKVVHPPEDDNHNNIISNNEESLKTYTKNNLILTKADIGHNPPKRLCNIPFTNIDILWPKCCQLICAEDIANKQELNNI